MILCLYNTTIDAILAKSTIVAKGNSGVVDDYIGMLQVLEFSERVLRIIPEYPTSFIWSKEGDAGQLYILL